MPTLAPDSVDAIVTDPPYGLSFMGKDWDRGVPGVEFWREAYRVAKPGAHLLAFGGTRTYHRQTSAIEDAGWEIRDCVMWVYGSGFPKSLDVSKAIDQRERGAMVRHKLLHFAEARGIDGKWLESHGVASASSFTDWTVGGHVPSDKNWQLVKAALGVTAEEESAYERKVVGQKTAGIANPDDRDRHTVGGSASVVVDITAPATRAAQQWSGWGTALKPAWEPIIVARKPCEGTVAANVLKYGTGAINVDGCRVAHNGESLRGGATDGSSANKVNEGWNRPWKNDPELRFAAKMRSNANQQRAEQLGRWPANVIHDGSDEVVGLFPDDGDASASRFFYCAKADGDDREHGNTHPTVKPNDLMRYLIKLIAPKDALILDPFMGSGSTGVAAIQMHNRFIGIELGEDHFEICKRRVAAAFDTFPLLNPKGNQ